MRRAEQPQQVKLAAVGVLILVDHQVAEARLPALAHRLVLAEQPQRLD